VDEPYSPWRTFLPFQDNWVMYLVPETLNGEPTLAVQTFGSDVLGHHGYSVRAGSGWYTRRPNWDFSYAYNGWYPTFTFGAGDSHVSYATDFGRVAEQRRSVRLGADWPMLERHRLTTSFVSRQDTPLDRLSELYLGSRDAAYVHAGYFYSRARGFAYSVSPEHGRAFGISARYYSGALGSDFDELLVRSDGRLYVNNPLFDNHVLALRIAGAVALGPEFGERLILGGNQADSLVTVQTDDIYPLRGFPLNLTTYPSTTGLAAAYAEYRFPLWHIERGLGTLPVFFERLHGSVFADSGATFGDGSEDGATEVYERAKRRLRGGRVGVGAELRMTLVLGWFAPFTFTSGVGFPVIENGLPTGDRALSDAIPYITLGTTL
jgi:hypothetical protein